VSTDPATVATIDEMLATMGSEDGLVQFHVAAEAIKLTREHESSGRAPGPPPKEGRAPGPEVVVSHGIDRSTLVSFRPPEVLRMSALVAAVTKPPSELWVNPAGLVAANGGRIETYPRTPSPA
jgi:hypothetical protein